MYQADAMAAILGDSAKSGLNRDQSPPTDIIGQAQSGSEADSLVGVAEERMDPDAEAGKAKARFPKVNISAMPSRLSLARTLGQTKYPRSGSSLVFDRVARRLFRWRAVGGARLAEAEAVARPRLLAGDARDFEGDAADVDAESRGLGVSVGVIVVFAVEGGGRPAGPQAGARSGAGLEVAGEAEVASVAGVDRSVEEDAANGERDRERDSRVRVPESTVGSLVFPRLAWLWVDIGSVPGSRSVVGRGRLVEEPDDVEDEDDEAEYGTPNARRRGAGREPAEHVDGTGEEIESVDVDEREAATEEEDEEEQEEEKEQLDVAGDEDDDEEEKEEEAEEEAKRDRVGRSDSHPRASMT
jgi:hypothetical protein